MSSGSRKSVETTLLFTAFIAATYGFGMYLFPAMVESVRLDIPFSYGTMGTISGFVQAGFMICALLAGFLTVRFGAMPMILGSISLCAIGLLGLAVAPNIIAMAICLTVLGGAAAAIWVPMVEVARDHISKEHQGKALGLMSSGTSYGVFINSFLLTTLLPQQGWRSLWLATGVLVGLLALVAMLRLRSAKGETAKDALTERVSVASRVKALPKALTAAILFMMFLNGLSCMPYQTYLSAFLQAEAGYSAETAAHMWRIIGVVGMVSGFAVGWLADRITVRIAMILTYAVLAGSCALLLNATGGASYEFLYIAAVTFGITFYAIFGLVPAYISHVFGQGSAALVFAFGNIALGLGGIVGNILGGALKVSSGSFEPIYMVMLGAAVASAVLSMLMPSEQRAFGEAVPANG
ncbi:MFS transporter [Frigidibacter sp. SD6-1]|uniref:MFS transporter n=1 Tax=Frigidibacter sp. SD6-1 TaxID=3032581 RepID=UPI0024E00D7A|nr:MFS transporter [Frigidibacter sp. SD6-1]